MNKNFFTNFIKKRKIAKIKKEIYILEKSELNNKQIEKLCALLDELAELANIPKFDVEKGWKEFEKYYLPIAEKFMEENEKGKTHI